MERQRGRGKIGSTGDSLNTNADGTLATDASCKGMHQLQVHPICIVVNNAQVKYTAHNIYSYNLQR